MADAFFGEIRAFPWNWPPYQWALCWGSTIQVLQNQALYAVIGTTFGGTAGQTFQLPDLRGRAAVGVGTGPNLTTWTLGEPDGADSVTLAPYQMPSHTHTVNARTAAVANVQANPAATTTMGRVMETPAGTVRPAWYGPDVPQTPATMAAAMIGSTGAALGQVAAHENRQPLLVMNYCICTEGYFPMPAQ